MKQIVSVRDDHKYQHNRSTKSSNAAKKTISLLIFVSIFLSLFGCSSADVPATSSESTYIPDLPLKVTETHQYRLSLVDAYIDEEYSYDDDEPEYSYVFKFEFENKHPTSNIRVALVNAEVNGYSLKGGHSDKTDTSFSVYTWSGPGSGNTALGTFIMAFDDIEAMTDVRDAKYMEHDDLSFTFRVFIIDEMDDYGEDKYFTIEDAFLYCYLS